MSDVSQQVVVVQATLPQYRVPVFEMMRRLLAERSIDLRLLHGSPNEAQASKQDAATLSWAEVVPTRVVKVGHMSADWRNVLHLTRGADLIIVEQAARRLENYALLLRQAVGGPRVAFWGHGRNFQATSSTTPVERLKTAISRYPAWWFAYNEASAAVVRAAGFPEERITVVNNAIDTRALIHLRASLSDACVSAVRERYGIHGGDLCVFSGGLYHEKRVPFLLQAADAIKARRPTFELVVIGGGPDQPYVEDAARSRPWLHIVGPRFGREKVELFASARLLLMPGLVGLVVLDAFALETPLVTTAVRYHSPEIAYLEPDVNGVLLPADTTAESYADAVIQLLDDTERVERLRRGCRDTALLYSIEDMAQRFGAGILQALADPQVDRR
jgi:L-malate glycosyltransferase